MAKMSVSGVLAIALVCMVNGCATSSAPAVDAAGGDAAVDAQRSCADVAAAYEATRSRLGCAYDWGRCPVIRTDEECISMFEIAPTCGALDSFASICSIAQ